MTENADNVEHAESTEGAGATEQVGRRDAGGAGRGGRRPPLWLMITAGVLVVALVVVVVYVLGNREGEPEPPPVAETTTLAPPTPTVDPVDREPGSAFFEALPDTVLQYALAEAGEDSTWLADDALESYRFVYTDGGSVELVVLAGQWRDAAAAQAVLDRLTADQPAVGTEVAGTDVDTADADTADADTADADTADADTAGAADAPATVEGGSVQVDGADVGRYLIVPHEDGSGTAWWTNGTVLFQVDGPASALRDFYTGFPL